MALTSFDVPKLDTGHFSPEECLLSYDEYGDILKLSQEPGRPATSVDVGGEFWVRVVPESGKVLGFEIEGFQSHFLKSHPELLDLWSRDQGQGFAKRCARVLLDQLKRSGMA